MATGDYELSAALREWAKTPLVPAPVVREAADELDKVYDALSGLIGLCVLVRGRNDCPAEIKEALTDSHRLADALSLLDALEPVADAIDADKAISPTPRP